MNRNIVTIHQPNFIPWLGYFHKMNLCGQFIILDNVQFTKDKFFHRTRINNRSKANWLTIPIQYSFKEKTLIKDVRIDHSVIWKRKHLNTLRTVYGGTEYFDLVYSELERLYSMNISFLAEFNVQFIIFISNFLGIKPDFIMSSDYAIDKKRTELLLELCRIRGAETYISGSSGKNYLDLKKFEDAGVKVEFHVFNHPLYITAKNNFIKNMSVIDLMFNKGAESGKIITQETPV